MAAGLLSPAARVANVVELEGLHGFEVPFLFRRLRLPIVARGRRLRAGPPFPGGELRPSGARPPPDHDLCDMLS